MKRASAPGKVILIGEHTALYGNPAIAIALEPRAHVTVEGRRDKEIVLTAPGMGVSGMPVRRHERGAELVKRAVDTVGGGFDIEIRSEIPTASGMGSSAAIASALVTALRAEKGLDTERESVARGAWECENEVHGRSSGIDPFAVTYGGLTLYKDGRVEKLNAGGFPGLVVAHSGVQSDTGDIVAAVDALREEDPGGFKNFLGRSEELALESRDCIAVGDWEGLGRAMDENHSLLAGIGLSSEMLDGLVEAARDAGVYGAKVSGAGRGGIMIALCDEKAEKGVNKALSSLGGKVIGTRFSEEGARLE